MSVFLKENKKMFLLAFVFSVFCFGFMLTHYMVNIDEETWLLNDSGSITWLLQNRYGIYIYDLLFTRFGRFTPFFADIIGIVLWNFSGALFGYVFFDFEKKNHWWIRLMMLCYYNSLPLCVGEAFGFTMQIIPESMAMVFTAAAFIGTVKPWMKNKKCNAAAVFVLLVASFGVYQALICVYVTAVAAWCLCRFLEGAPLLQEMVAGACYSVVSIVAYFLINWGIGKMVGTASYLTGNYLGWTDQKGILNALFLSFANVARVSLGITIDDVRIYGAVPLRILMLLFIAVVVMLFLKKKGLAQKAGIALFSLGLVCAPFSLYLALGTYKTPGRMMIALSLAGMIEILIIYESFSRSLTERAIGLIFAGILVANASNMNQIYYHSYLVYQHDKAIADAIMYDIERQGHDYHAKAVVFIGSREMDDIPILKSGSLGGSFFSWDGGNIGRMIDFFELEGYVLHMPQLEQIENGLRQSETMKTWPQEGSIVETDDSIVVYLSKPSEKWHGTNLGR